MNNNYLQHYGVIGMRWGVRKQPEHSYNKRKRRRTNNRLLIGRGFVNKFLSRNVKVSDLKRIKNEQITDSVGKTNPGMLLSQNAIDSFLNHQILEFNNYRKDLKAGRLANCGNCTIALDLRSKGYDVVAGTNKKGIRWEDYGKLTNSPMKMLDGSEYKGWAESSKQLMNQKGSISDVEAAIKKQGKNSSGTLGVIGLSGHFVHYKNQNGKITIHDGQLRKNYKSLDDFYNGNKVNKSYIPSRTLICRTDNAEPNIQKLLDDGIIKPRQ